MFSLTYWKDIANLLFWVLGHAWLPIPIMVLLSCRKLSRFFCRKNINFIPHVFLEILQRYANFLLWVLWACLVAHTQNDDLSTCRRIWYLSACQKYTSSFTSFLRNYILKNPAIWLADSILPRNLRTRILPDIGLVVKYQ